MSSAGRLATIVIPTHNRSDFLRRLLCFFSNLKVDSQIIVADSSDERAFAANARTLDSCQGKLSIAHVRYSCGLTKKCLLAVQSVSTPYTVMCADDDFLLPDSVTRCVEFMEANPDYSCASGVYVSVKPEKTRHWDEMRCFSNESPDPILRFRRMAEEWCSTFYHVFRTPALQQSWLLADSATDYDRARVFTEVLLAQLSPVYGKVAILPQLHLLFQLHSENSHRKIPLVLDSEARSELYERFACALAEELADASGETSARCRAIVEEYHELWWHGSIPTGTAGRFLQRWKRKLKNYRLFLSDLLSSDKSRVRVRRRLRQHDARCKSTAWQSAQELAVRFPSGMPEHECS